MVSAVGLRPVPLLSQVPARSAPRPTNAQGGVGELVRLTTAVAGPARGGAGAGS